MCTHAKAGSTTWKIILANNTSDKIPNVDPETIMIHTDIKSYELKTLTEFSIEGIKERLQNYYKFMVVRHPFDRYVLSLFFF